jgi:hypothetical protein
MSVAPKVSDFMIQLGKELVEKKGVSESTATSYIKNLMVLNNKVPFTTLAFLRKKDDVMARVKTYAESTQKTLLASIVSVLSLYSEKPTYKGIFKFYYEEMMGKAKEMRANETNEKTDKQKENWINWKEVQEKVNAMRKEVIEMIGQKTISSKQYETLLNYVVLSLYTYTQPRRNQDYLDMVVVKKWKDGMDTSKNYLDLAGQQFIFNKYKTAKKYGQQKLAIPNTPEAPLFDTLVAYLRFHAPFKATKGKEPVPFLVFEDGRPLTAVNAITRILNKVFGKKVGSSMLRHIFLSDKYDIKEMEEDAAAMGHSVEEQKKYMKVE